MADQEQWPHLLELARRLCGENADAIFIGGIAVAQHVCQRFGQLEEWSHDGDLYISLLGKHALRDRYEVIRNERPGKDSVTIEGEDMDLYVERQNALAVPYQERRKAPAFRPGI